MDDKLDLFVAKIIVDALLRERERQESQAEEAPLARPSRLGRWVARFWQFRAAGMQDDAIQGAVTCDATQSDSL